MFAKDRRTAVEIAAELATDSLIGPQGIVYRAYVPLKCEEVDPVCGIPYANEYRFFFVVRNGEAKEVAHGYYWNIAQNTNKEAPPEAAEFAHKVAQVAAPHANFFVLDVAEKAAGGWVLVEVNDGQCAGLSCIDPDVFYRNLREVLTDISANSIS